MKRTLFLFLLALTSSSTINAQNRIECSFPQEKLFSMGSYYYPEQWPREQWDRDFKTMRDMGIEFTHFAEFAWAMLEPEDGVFDFEWLDEAIALAAKHGLKVIMCTPSACPPVWLSEQHPEILFKTWDGYVWQHSRRVHASYSSDIFCGKVSRIVTEMARHYGDNPAVIGWQIDNEPGHYGINDYSDNALVKWRMWLKNKYGSIDELNRVWDCAFWSETYTDFGQVRMPNGKESVSGPNPHAYLDFNRFQNDEVVRFLNMQADLLHENISEWQWVTTNMMTFAPNVYRAEHPDFLSFTIYPLGDVDGVGEQGFRLGDPNFISRTCDIYRNRQGGGFGVMELQPGQINWASYCVQPFPGAIRLWAWNIFAGGGDFVCTYRFRQPLRNSEQYHYGMTGPDGVTLSPGGREYSQTASEMRILRESYHRDSAEPDDRRARHSAILFNADNYWDMDYQRQSVEWDSMTHIDKYYNALKSLGSKVNFICEDDRFEDYPFVLAPAYQLLDSSLVVRWREYVVNGGHLILTCRTGQKDREAALWEAPLSAPIYDLAGIESLFFDVLPSGRSGKVDFDGEEWQWNNWADVMTASAGTEIWGRWSDQFYMGKAAVTHRRIGRGTVTYIGVDTDEGLLEKAILKRLFTEAGVSVEDIPYGVIDEWRDGFRIVLNYMSKPYIFPIPDGKKVLVGSELVHSGKAVLPPAGVMVLQ